MNKVLTLVLTLFFSGIALPCGWDWDTIEMEKQQFPSIHELITGKFLRHSPEFYYWRIKDRKEKLKRYPDSLEFYDDLGVAYDKIGDDNNAIAIMLEKEKKKPGLYETYANLGTFYIHNGQMEEGLEYMRKAIKINPNAHFGREIYQQYLVEYMLEKKKGEKFPLPLAIYNRKNNFYHFLKRRHIDRAVASGANEHTELAKALKGVSGMMKFGNYQSPYLLEAIGDLLLETKSFGGAGHLASRAYLKASFACKDSVSAGAYYRKASLAREQSYSMEHGQLIEDSLGRQRQLPPTTGYPVMSMKELENALKQEVLSADTWFEEIRKQEIEWINKKLNADSLFAATYYLEPIAEPVPQHIARKKLGQSEEVAWLKRQYDVEAQARGIHAFSQLDDSTKKALDAIYSEEFQHLNPKDDSTAIAANMGQETVPKGHSRLWWYLFAVGVVGGLLLYLDFKGKNKA